MGGPLTRAEDRPVLEVIYEVVGELLAGIRSTISYYASAHPAAPPQRIQLSGGGAQLQGLPAALQELTGLPVTPAESALALPSKNTRDRAARPDQDAYTTALGLALGSHS